jgi:hypothetical protein
LQERVVLNASQVAMTMTETLTAVVIGYDDVSAAAKTRHIQHTVRYTELLPTRFKDFWR